MKKILSIILSVTLVFAMSSAVLANNIVVCPEDTELPQEVKILKVGINAEYPPFEYYEDDVLTGFDIDLMNYICERIGYDIEFVNMPFDKLIPAVANGEIDCAISAITITKERDSVIDYTMPYLAANVTYKEGEEWSEYDEKYAIVFPNIEIASIKSSITPEEYLYKQVNSAIEELRDNHTIEKLIEKYNLNKPFDEEAEINYTYVIPENTIGADDADTMDEADWTEATAVPAPSEWAAKDIDFAYAMGITDSNKQYIYKNNITREEFCELIYNLVTLVKWEITAPVTNSFTDTKNDKILMLNGLGIINGKSATEFAPNDFLTREEAATIIIRMINKIMPMAATEIWFEYDDIDEISKWASDSIQTISNLGFMNGVGNNKFAPKDTYTTEQAIVTLVRVYANFSEGKNVTIPVITNAENLSYAQIEDLQKQVDEGHFPWRLDYKQVITSFISDLGENVEKGELVSFAGDDAKCSGTYIVGNNSYLIELFKPIDKSEHGIWVVRTCDKTEVK